MARLRRRECEHVHRIAIAEDDEDLRSSLVGLFEREGHEVRVASDADGAVELVREFRPHLMLLDYYLHQGTGADVVRQMRTFEDLTQVLLVTGYASEQPPRTLLADLDIQGYHDKSDGPGRLMVLADSALKHYRLLARMEARRAYLRQVVDSGPDIMRIQSPDELLHSALRNAVALLRAAGGVVATVNSGVFVFDDANGHEVAVRAGEGRYQRACNMGDLPAPVVAAIRQGLSSPLPRRADAGGVVIPLETRNGERGCLFIEAPDLPSEAVEACQLYARQVVQGLENMLLYRRATIDPLTELCNRGHGEQRLQEMLRLGTRTGKPTGLALLDVDNFKSFNDEHGHAAGDLVLRRVAAAVRDQLRTTDLVARWGGEEFVIGLPATDAVGTAVAMEKLRSTVQDLTVRYEGRDLSVTFTAGCVVAEPGQLDLHELLEQADVRLYRGKRLGRNQVCGPDADSDVFAQEKRHVAC